MSNILDIFNDRLPSGIREAFPDRLPSGIREAFPDLSNSNIKSFIYYSENTEKTLKMIDKILQMNNYKVMCLYDSKENQIDKNGVINNKCNIQTLNNINLFVSNKRTIANSPIIILNNLSLESINLIKSDCVLKRPKSYNLSVIVIGSMITDIFEN
jgi:hypothetical protein